jgi:hypothetical protein
MGSGTRAAQIGEPSPLPPLGRKKSAFPKTLRIETVASASPFGLRCGGPIAIFRA